MSDKTTQIRMTHENGMIINIVRHQSDIEKAIRFARQCGYIKFESEQERKEDKTGRNLTTQ
jgi:hypothetical protein